MIWVVFLVACALTYAISGIPSGKILASLSGVDITQVGSKNIGMTNVARVCGIYQGILTLMCDMCKAFFSLKLSFFLLTCAGALLAPHAPDGWMLSWLYATSVIGHIFSPYLKFHGGKGIAVGFGGALALFLPLAVCLLVAWAITLVLSRYISVASITGAALLPILALGLYWPAPIAFFVPFLLIAFLVIWSHRANIMRLKQGVEPTCKALRKEGSHA